ncbi:hypothetical protein STEG23_038260 [Scotinomys teguina]
MDKFYPKDQDGSLRSESRMCWPLGSWILEVGARPPRLACTSSSLESVPCPFGWEIIFQTAIVKPYVSLLVVSVVFCAPTSSSSNFIYHHRPIIDLTELSYSGHLPDIWSSLTAGNLGSLEAHAPGFLLQTATIAKLVFILLFSYAKLTSAPHCWWEKEKLTQRLSEKAGFGERQEWGFQSVQGIHILEARKASSAESRDELGHGHSGQLLLKLGCNSCCFCP